MRPIRTASPRSFLGRRQVQLLSYVAGFHLKHLCSSVMTVGHQDCSNHRCQSQCLSRFPVCRRGGLVCCLFPAVCQSGSQGSVLAVASPGLGTESPPSGGARGGTARRALCKLCLCELPVPSDVIGPLRRKTWPDQ